VCGRQLRRLLQRESSQADQVKSVKHGEKENKDQCTVKCYLSLMFFLLLIFLYVVAYFATGYRFVFKK